MPSGPSSAEIPPPPADARAPFRVATVRRQFDRIAARHARHDALPREVERRLFERLALMRLAPARVLDLGCGAGASRALFAARFPQAQWLGVDLSPAMLAQRAAAGRWRRWRERLFAAPAGDVLCADAARLPLRDGCCDLAYSNLMPHWHPVPHRLFPEARRVLRDGGLLLFSCFGPDSLRELLAACAQALPRARPLPFVDMHDYGDMLMASGFAAPVMEVERLTLTYPSPQALLLELRALGANPRDDRPAALPSTREARALFAALASQRGGDGRIAVSVEVIFGHAWAAAPRAGAVATVPLAALRAGPGRPR